MAVSGADPEQLRALARQLDAAAERLDGTGRSLTALVGNQSSWRGTDADRFRSQWNGQSARVIDTVAQSLRQASDTLRHNAAEQDTASSADSGQMSGAAGPRNAEAETSPGRAAGSASGLWQQLKEVPPHAYRLQTVVGADGQTRYVVYIGGTQSELLGDGQTKLSNVAAARGQLDGPQVQQLARLIPPDAEVMLVGHSQGGMDAQNIAKSGGLNVSQIITFGSPSRDDLDVPAIHLRAEKDPIPGSTSIASRTGVAAGILNPGLLPGLLSPLIDSAPYAGSDLHTGENNVFYKVDSGLREDDWVAHHNEGYDKVSKFFDRAVSDGEYESTFDPVRRFQGTAAGQVDIDPKGNTS